MSLEKMLRNELPLNRKERFYTGTVLPMIICKDNFKYFHLFQSIFNGLDTLDIISNPDNTNIQFFTEYSLVESISSTSKQRFKNLPKAKDTPDIVILINSKVKILLAFEAKMYATPTGDQLNYQMKKQQDIIECIRDSLCIDKIYHYALIPEKLKNQISKLNFPIITWESIYEKFYSVCRNDYFFAMLKMALDSYDNLVSQSSLYGQNYEEKILGQEIYKQFKNGDFDKCSMGRKGGFSGNILKEDINSGNWKTYCYETTSKKPPNRNWFLIKDFVELIDEK